MAVDQRPLSAPAPTPPRGGAPGAPPSAPGLARRVGRAYVRPAIEAAAQQPRIWKYRLLSTCRRIEGEPVVLQPVLFVGPGQIVLGDSVQFGWKSSPLFYAGYCHVETTGPGAR